MDIEEIILICKNDEKGRDEAFRQLVDRFHQPFTRHFIRKGRLNESDAKDVAQEVFIKIIKGFKTYQAEGRGEAWLWRIARNGLVDFKRKKYRDNRDRPSVIDNDDLFEASNVTPKQICLNRGLTRFMKEEPDRASSLEMLAEGRSITEISAALGRSIGATKEYLSQCRKKLKPYVQHCYELLKGY